MPTTTTLAGEYVPALDGLRAIAILGVLGFHVFPGTLAGGFTGVDVFFVLSGYLITSILLRDLRGGQLSLREFFLRRLERLYPNALLTVFISLGLFATVLLPLQTVDVAKHGLWAIFNLSNVYIWKTAGGYWGEAAAAFPLLHTWSLAVEEQFYLVFPPLLALFWRWRRRISLLTACLALASLTLWIAGSRSHAGITFYFLPTRAWEPLLGALLATHRGNFPPSSNQWLGWAGLAGILTGFAVIGKIFPFPGLIALLPASGAAAVLISTRHNQRTGPARALSHPILVSVGKLSYSIYLWHWPLIVIGREYARLTNQSPLQWTVLGASVGVVLAVAAYFLVERPMRGRGPGRPRRLRVLAAGFAVCALACLIASRRHPVADPLQLFDRPTFYGQAYSLTPWSRKEFANWAEFADVLLPAEPEPMTSTGPDLWNKGGVIHDWGLGGGRPRVVVLGSSHAVMYSRLIDDICRRLGLPVAFFVAPATAVFFPTQVGIKMRTIEQAQSFDRARRKWLDEWHPDVIVVADRWDRHFEKPGQFERELRGLAAELAPRAKHVILLSQVPVLRLGAHENLREYVTWWLRRTGSLPAIGADSQEPERRAADATMAAVAREFPNLQVLREDQPFEKDDGSVRYSQGRKFFYADDNHLSDAGAEVVRDLCTQAIMAGVR